MHSNEYMQSADFTACKKILTLICKNVCIAYGFNNKILFLSLLFYMIFKGEILTFLLSYVKILLYFSFTEVIA